MEAFLGALALAAITAITVVAYRHPKGYAKIFKVITTLVFGGFCCTASFAVGVEIAREKMKPYILADKITEAARAVSGVTPDPTLTALACLLVWGYFLLLSYLPTFLEHDPENRPR